ncbi:transmembrane protein 116-like [Halichondria panicea]|uniref:transmembrane protein 116-like n=1 Tax=Halichondria panicea TaxID=6063 RepID=UPI00312BCA12
MEDIINNSSLFCPGTNSSFLERSFVSVLEDGNLTTTTNACNCTQWNLDTVDAEPIAIIRIITSTISVFGSASIILSVLLSGKLNKAEVHPLFILSVADFILSILWMIGGVVWLSPGQGGWARNESDPHTGMCYVLGVSTSMAAMVTYFLTLIYAQNALIRVIEMYVNKGKLLSEKDKRKKFRYFFTLAGYILSWVLPLFILIPAMESIVGIESTNYGCWCVPDFFNIRPDDGLEVSHFQSYAKIHATVLGSTFLVSTTLIITLYILTFVFARKVMRLQQENSVLVDEGRNKKQIKTIIARLTAFILIFFICGLPIIAACIDIWHEDEKLHLDEPVDRVILYFHAILAPLQGFLNALVYGWTRKEFRKALSVGDRIKSLGRGYQSVTGKSEYNSGGSMNLNRANPT